MAFADDVNKTLQLNIGSWSICKKPPPKVLVAVVQQAGKIILLGWA